MKTSDNDIDGLLERISSEDFYDYEIYNVTDEDILFESMKERKDLLYLKDDLGLIKELFKSTDKVIFCITKKGNDVIKSGGWTNYCAKEKNREKWTRIRKLSAYAAAIIIPVISTVIALEAVRTEKGKIIEQQENTKEIKTRLEKVENMLKTNRTQNKTKKENDSLNTFDSIETE